MPVTEVHKKFRATKSDDDGVFGILPEFCKMFYILISKM